MPISYGGPFVYVYMTFHVYAYRRYANIGKRASERAGLIAITFPRRTRDDDDDGLIAKIHLTTCMGIFFFGWSSYMWLR